MEKNAQELCSELLLNITKNLTDEEEELVVDYLDNIGIEVDLDVEQNKMCRMLFDSLTKKLPGRVPVQALANKILDDRKIRLGENVETKTEESLEERRDKISDQLLTSGKTTCVLDESNIVPTNQMYKFITDELGITTESDYTHYNAVVKLPIKLYEKIFFNVENPVLKITKFGGNHESTYVKINGYNDKFYTNESIVEPIEITDITDDYKNRIIIDKHTPYISHVKFIYYGDKKELNKNLLAIRNSLKENDVRSFRVGSTVLADKGYKFMVGSIKDENNRNVSIGRIKYDMDDIKFDIESKAKNEALILHHNQIVKTPTNIISVVNFMSNDKLNSADENIQNIVKSKINNLDLVKKGMVLRFKHNNRNVSATIVSMSDSYGKNISVGITKSDFRFKIEQNPDNQVFISPLVAQLIGVEKNTIASGNLVLCTSMPYISHIEFVYYGTQEELDKNLTTIQQKLPNVINSFSVLKSGMVLKFKHNDGLVRVMINSMKDENNIIITTGMIMPGLSDIKFEIEPDQ